MPIAQIIRQAETFRLLPNHEFYLAGTTQSHCKPGPCSPWLDECDERPIHCDSLSARPENGMPGVIRKNQDRLYIPVL